MIEKLLRTGWPVLLLWGLVLGTATTAAVVIWRGTRGLRNKNPGNIEDNGTAWQGLDSPRNDGRFLRFASDEYGIRALARTLMTYNAKHGLRTVRAIINRWAPSTENNTSSYIASVSAALGVLPDSPLVLTDAVLLQLVGAIVKHENGVNPYSDELILQGIRMARA